MTADLFRDLILLLKKVIPSRTVLNNCLSLIQREQVGLVKYGTSLPDSGLTRKQLLVHAREEALDLANYLEAAIHTESEYEAKYLALREDFEQHIRYLRQFSFNKTADRLEQVFESHDTSFILRSVP